MVEKLSSCCVQSLQCLHFAKSKQPAHLGNDSKSSRVSQRRERTGNYRNNIYVLCIKRLYNSLYQLIIVRHVECLVSTKRDVLVLVKIYVTARAELKDKLSSPSHAELLQQLVMARLKHSKNSYTTICHYSFVPDI